MARRTASLPNVAFMGLRCLFFCSGRRRHSGGMGAFITLASRQSSPPVEG